MDIHVIFGTGPIGLAVMDELVRKGKSIRMVNRSGKANVPDQVEVIQGNATDAAFTREACKGAAVIYNCTNPPYTEWIEKFPPLQAGVLEGAASAGAKLIAMENLYMYGPTEGKPLTENLPNAANTRKGRVRAKMTENLIAAHKSGKVRVAIGRGSDYFGPGAVEQSAVGRVFTAALEGKPAQVIGNPDMPHTYSYIPDIGKGLVTLDEHDEALGQIWHLPNAPTVTTRRFIELVFKEAGRPARAQPAPKLLLKGMALFSPIMREVAEMLYEFDEPFIVDSSKFERAFGEHATPLDESIHTTFEWFHNHFQVKA
jgi:nucleoside-diphosphate-sugar epimerase